MWGPHEIMKLKPQNVTTSSAFGLLLLGVPTADHLPLSHTITSVLLSHATHLHVLLHHIHEAS